MERKIIAFLKKIYHFIKGTKLEQFNSLSKPIIYIQDEYIDWLLFANAGMLHRGNLYCIDYAVKNIASNNPVIEIGSFCGLSTNIINYYLNKYNKSNKIITSDKWEFEGKSDGMLGESIISHAKYKDFVMDSFKRNVSLFSSFNLPYAIEVFSDDFFEMWSINSLTKDVFQRTIELGGPISFAFVDGNHSFEFAKRDFENIDKYLEIGGYILFDDSADDTHFECKNLMKEIEVNPKYKLVIKNPNYLFKKVR
jgi:hypothetical protein